MALTLGGQDRRWLILPTPDSPVQATGQSDSVSDYPIEATGLSGAVQCAWTKLDFEFDQPIEGHGDDFNT